MRLYFNEEDRKKAIAEQEEQKTAVQESSKKLKDETSDMSKMVGTTQLIEVEEDQA